MRVFGYTLHEIALRLVLVCAIVKLDQILFVLLNRR